MPDHKQSGIARNFGDLKVRPKLIVLHNLFFLVLSCAAYFSLIPLFEQQIRDAHTREFQILEEARRGGASEKELAALLPRASYDETLLRAKLRLFLVLGIIYVLAVLLLERVVMPLYVYQPLQRMLEADAATRSGDRQRELIPEAIILGDEIGQIMRSRNETVESLRHHEDELASALRRLEAQDRLVSLGLLSASVAHELNTPLAVLNGSIEKLLETTQDSQTIARLERMRRVATRLRKISESLVDFSRVRKQSTESVPIQHLLDEAWNLVAIEEKASRVSFANQVDARLQATANPDRLMQVFVNVLKNALHAVALDTGRIETNAKKSDWGGSPGLLVTISDNGPGIPSEVLPDIFDAFVSSRLDAQGTGLGLTVSEGIMTQHGGKIRASNRPEGGACIELWLPDAVA